MMESAGMEALRAAMILFATSLVSFGMRRSSSARRHFVWVLGVAAVLVLPVAGMVLPAWRVSVPTGPIAHRSADRAPAPFIHATSSDPILAAAIGGEEIPVGRNATTVVGSSVAGVPTARDGVVDERAGPAISAGMPVFAAYIAGALLTLAYMLCGVLAAGRFVRRARVADDERILALTELVRAEFAITRRVRVYHAGETMPVTWGHFRPVIVLPESAVKFTDARLAAVIRHELAHIRRGDAFTQALAQIVCVLHWYNPLSWLAASRMRVEREHACDDILLQSGHRASDYAEDLLSLARAFGGARPLPLAAVAMARPSSLRVRLSALLDEHRRRSAVSRQFAVPASIGALALLIPVSTMLPVGRSALSQSRFHAPRPETPANHPVRDRAERRLPTVTTLPTPPAAPAPRQPAMMIASPGEAVMMVAPQESGPCLSRDTKNRSTSVNSNNGRYDIRYSGESCKGEVRIRGDLKFDRSFTRIAGLSNGGSLLIEETDRGTTRRLEATPSGSGLAYSWSIDGKSRPFDASAQAWLDAWTIMLFREMGFAADERAAAMLDAGGLDAILREVGLMQSDYVQSSYLGVAMERGHLSNADVDRVLAVVASSIESDYYTASILSRAAAGMTFNAQTQQSYLKAARTIDSDYYREEVLSDLLENGRLNDAQVSEVLAQSKMISSDYYLATLLEHVADRYGVQSSMRSAYLSAVQGIEGDYYKLGVLQQLLKQRDLTESELAAVITAGRSIASDYYQADLLQQAARHGALRGAAREALNTNLQGIQSSTYRSSVEEVLRRR